MNKYFLKVNNKIIKRRKSVRTYKTDEVSNETIEKLNKYIEKEFKYTLDKPEKVYLLVHLTKIL